jgi:hypothetical protein
MSQPLWGVSQPFWETPRKPIGNPGNVPEEDQISTLGIHVGMRRDAMR